MCCCSYCSLLQSTPNKNTEHAVFLTFCLKLLLWGFLLWIRTPLCWKVPLCRLVWQSNWPVSFLKLKPKHTLICRYVVLLLQTFENSQSCTPAYGPRRMQSQKVAALNLFNKYKHIHVHLHPSVFCSNTHTHTHRSVVYLSTWCLYGHVRYVFTQRLGEAGVNICLALFFSIWNFSSSACCLCLSSL